MIENCEIINQPYSGDFEERIKAVPAFDFARL